MKVIIGIPAFNEEKNIGSIVAKLKIKYDHVIVCDDGSSDMTETIASSLGAIVVKHSKNLGYGAAIKTIFNESKKIDGDVLVTFDADGQHQISEIDSVLKPLFENKADIVIGSRFLGTTKNLPKYRKFGIKTITGLTNTMTGSNLSDAQSGFRAYSKNVLNEISPTDSGMGISTEILIKSSKKNMKITIVGAGAVGASCAEYIAIKDFASEVVILDIKEGFAEGKAMDLMQTASLNGFDTKIVGVTNDYSKTAGSDIVVITSGIPRKPGMTREELIGINAGIVKTVSANLIEHSPNTIIM